MKLVFSLKRKFTAENYYEIQDVISNNRSVISQQQGLENNKQQIVIESLKHFNSANLVQKILNRILHF